MIIFILLTRSLKQGELSVLSKVSQLTRHRGGGLELRTVQLRAMLKSMPSPKETRTLPQQPLTNGDT